MIKATKQNGMLLSLQGFFYVKSLIKVLLALLSYLFSVYLQQKYIVYGKIRYARPYCLEK